MTDGLTFALGCSVLFFLFVLSVSSAYEVRKGDGC